MSRALVIRPSVASDAEYRYLARATLGRGVSVAVSLLALWDRPWSPRALRFATHAVAYALSRGLDVMEVPTRSTRA